MTDMHLRQAKLLVVEPRKRLTAAQALTHPWLQVVLNEACPKHCFSPRPVLCTADNLHVHSRGSAAPAT